MADFDLGFDDPQAGAAVSTPNGGYQLPNGALSDFTPPQKSLAKQPSNDFDLGFTPPPTDPKAQSWAQYAGDPSHPMLNRVGSALVEEGSRIGSGLYNGAKSAVTGDWFAPLAHQTGQETAQNTATPATAGKVASVAGALTSGDMLAPELPGANLVRATPSIPTDEALHSLGSAQYKALDNSGVNYTTSGLSDMADSIRNGLYHDSKYPINAPTAHWVLDQFGGLQDQALAAGAQPGDSVGVPLGYVRQLRGVLSDTLRGPNRNTPDGVAASSAMRGIDAFLEKPPQDAVLSGDAEGAANLAKTANGNWAALKRSNLLTGVDEGATYRANSRYSGRNYDNILRQRLDPYLDPTVKSKNLANFNPPEQAAVENVVNGGPLRNRLRTIGNVGAGGGGVGAFVEGAIAGHEFGPAGWGLPIVGALARSGANALAKRSLNKADELVRSRSPLFAERQANAPLEVQPNAPGMAAIRAIGPANSGLANNDDQPQYAKGGAVKSKHDRLVSRLMSLADKAKAAEKSKTKNILRLPDNTVTTALAKANAAI